VTSTLLDCDSPCIHAQPDGSPGRQRVIFAKHQQYRVALSGELRQSHGHRSRQRWRAVEDHEPERATPQQDIRAPRAALRIGWADDPQRAHVRPIARHERPRRVDVRDPLIGPRDDVTHERCLAATEWTRDLGQSPSREPTREGAVQRLDARRDAGERSERSGRRDGGEALFESKESRGRHVS
jgi:hypothetical protein